MFTEVRYGVKAVVICGNGYRYQRVGKIRILNSVVFADNGFISAVQVDCAYFYAERQLLYRPQQRRSNCDVQILLTTLY
jgi:hypothetical protein